MTLHLHNVPDIRDHGRTRNPHGLTFADVSTDAMTACIALVERFDYMTDENVEDAAKMFPRSYYKSLLAARAALRAEWLR